MDVRYFSFHPQRSKHIIAVEYKIGVIDTLSYLMFTNILSVLFFRDKAPGQKECDTAIEKLNKLTNDLDQTVLMGCSQNLPQKKSNSLQGYTDNVQTSANEISERLNPLKQAAKYQAENVGHSVRNILCTDNKKKSSKNESCP